MSLADEVYSKKATCALDIYVFNIITWSLLLLVDYKPPRISSTLTCFIRYIFVSNLQFILQAHLDRQDANNHRIIIEICSATEHHLYMDYFVSSMNICLRNKSHHQYSFLTNILNISLLFVFVCVKCCSTRIDYTSNMAGVLLETGTAYLS